MIEFISTVISIGQSLKNIKDAKDGYGWVSGLFIGKKPNEIERRIDQKFEQLAERIWVSPEWQAVRDITQSRQQQIDGKREQVARLEPVQRGLQTDIVSSAMILAPEKMGRRMLKDPFDLFIYPKPVGLAKPHSDPSLVPVIFEWEGQWFIGWQKREMLGVVFDCELNELWLPPQPQIHTVQTSQTLNALREQKEVLLKQVEAKKRAAAEQERTRLEAERARQQELAEQERVKAEIAALEMELRGHQESLMEHGTPFRDPFLKSESGEQGPELVFIGPGSFKMGEKSNNHPVTFANPFAIGKYPVTFDEYDAFCAADEKGRVKPSDADWGRGRRPVIDVSWEDAVAYCKWLSEQTGATYRLPSEAEWEYACRAGSVGEYSFGDDENQLGQYAWFNGNSGGKTQPVGEKDPNEWGLRDMHGNVWEWCQDCWHGDYKGAPSDGSAWESGGSFPRVLRGGSWYYIPHACRAASRDSNTPDNRDNNYGFRVVCVVPART